MDEKRQSSYKYLNNRLTKALKSEFYFEAIMIEYNFIEDRLIALLHYVGVVNRDAKLEVTKRTRKVIRYLRKMKPREKFGIKNINGKIETIKAIINAEETKFDSARDTKYLSTVIKQIDKTIDRRALNELLQRCYEWKEIRNTYVHNLCKGLPDNYIDESKQLALDGKNIFRDLDSFVEKISKKNNIIKENNLY